MDSALAPERSGTFAGFVLASLYRLVTVLPRARDRRTVDTTAPAVSVRRR